MMGFTKYQATEAAEVVSPEGHEAISNELSKLGKTSARNLTPDERESVNRGLEQASRSRVCSKSELDN